MAITDTQQAAQFSADASVSAAEAKQYLLEAQQGYQDTSEAAQEARNAAESASSSEQNASTSEANASQSATEASAARDEAVIAASTAAEFGDNKFTFYKTSSDPDGTIAGLAATTNGQSFRVAEGPEATAAFKTYENRDGVAVLQASQPGTAAITGTVREYSTLSLAENDVSAGNILDGAKGWITNDSNSTLADEFVNNGGVIEYTGRQIPSKQSVSDAIFSIMNPGRNIYNYRTSLDGKYLNEQGIVSDNSSYMLSDYIPVTELCSYATNYTLRFVHFFNSDRELLSYQEQQTSISTPESCIFIRITMGIASKLLLQIEAGTMRTAFESYRENVSKSLPDTTPLSIRDAMGVSPGKNLLNKSAATQGYAINETGNLVVASTYFVSDYIPIAAAASYRGNQPLRYIAYYNSAKAWLSTTQNVTSAFTAPTNASYMRVSILLARIDYSQIEAGSQMTPLAGYTLTATSSLDGGSIAYPVNVPNIYNIGLLQSGKNIYNPYTNVAGYIDENGFVVPGGTAYKFSDYLPVSSSAVYTANKSMRFVSFYEANKAFISTVTSTSSITTPATAAYVRVTLALANITGFQLEKGSVSSTYEAFYYTVKSNMPNGEPVSIETSGVEITPDYFGLERLRETHQRLNKLSFGATGLTARLTWAMIGDSYTRDTSRYALRSGRRLWSIYQSGAANVASGPIGWGYLSFGGADTTSSKNGSIINPNAVTSSGFVGTYYGGDSPDISVMASSTAGSTLTWDEDFRLGRAHTLLAEGGSGIISYLATGMSTATQIDLSAMSAGIQSIPLTDIPTTSSGTFTITVISGSVKLYGMNIADASAAGVVCHKLGASGSSSADWMARDANRWEVSFSTLGANLTSIMLGTNDQGAAMTPATFKTNIIGMIDRVRAARPTTDVLLVCPQENQRTDNVYPMSAYAQAMYEIALNDRDCGFLWLQNDFGVKPADYAYGSARPWMIADGIHPDPDTGGYAIVAALMRALGLPAV